jgi:hypothetical protein
MGRKGNAETRGWRVAAMAPQNQAQTGNGTSAFQLLRIVEVAIIGFKDKVWGKVSNKSNGDGVISKRSSEI